ncbi:MAG: hypothetical protein ACLU8W_08065 [Clostridia bacterium]
MIVNLLGSFSIKSVQAMLLILIGVILIVVWKAKHRGKVMLGVGIGALGLSGLLIVAGVIETYVLPIAYDGDPFELTDEEIHTLCDAVTTDQAYLNDFLPGNESQYEQTTQDTNRVAGTEYTYERYYKTVQHSMGDVFGFTRDAFSDPKTAQDYLRAICENNPPGAEEGDRYLTAEDYEVLVDRVSCYTTGFPNWHAGEYSSLSVRMYIRHDRYVICIFENKRPAFNPNFYRLARENAFFAPT